MLQSVKCYRSTLVQLLSQREPNKCVLQCVEPPVNHVWVPMQSFAPQQDEGQIKCAQCILTPCAHTSITLEKNIWHHAIAACIQPKQFLQNTNSNINISCSSQRDAMHRQRIKRKLALFYESVLQKSKEANYFNSFFVELLFRAVFYRWSLFILAMSLLMGCYASLNKLKLSSILLMIMLTHYGWSFQKNKVFFFLWFSPMLSHSLGPLQCL